MKTKKLLKMKILLVLALIIVVLAAVISGCSSNTEAGESLDSDIFTVSEGEHEHEGGEGNGEHGEESGTEYGLDDTFDVVRNGARLILVYDAARNAFTGTVENTTSNTLPQVRVEVHLSNGIELGPTTPIDLPPGEKVVILLSASNQAFSWWSAHPEVGGGESGSEHGNGG